MFLLLIIYSLGVFWSTFFPQRSWVEGTRFEWLGPTLHFINPGTFKLKEVRLEPSICQHFLPQMQHVIASVVASSASYGSTAVLNFSVQRVSAASNSPYSNKV